MKFIYLFNYLGSDGRKSTHPFGRELKFIYLRIHSGGDGHSSTQFVGEGLESISIGMSIGISFFIAIIIIRPSARTTIYFTTSLSPTSQTKTEIWICKVLAKAEKALSRKAKVFFGQ